MMSVIHKILWPIIAAILSLLVAGCNTLEGAGEDVEEAGEAVQEVADEDDAY